MSIMDFFIGAALAQAPAPEDTIRHVDIGSARPVNMGAGAELAVLAGGAVAFFLLIKLYTRWPKAEPWLVGISLAAFVPVASFVLRWATNGRAAYSETLPWLVVIAPLMGGAWWLVKHKTQLLNGPDAVSTFKAKRPAVSERESRPAPPPVEPPWEATQPEASRPAAAPTPAPAAARASPKDRIFISYRRHDSADVTGRIYDRLIQRFGKDQVFKDVDSIPLGVDFRDHLGSVVGRCNLVLAVIGDQWLTSAAAGGGRRLDDAKDFVRIELESALERRIPVIPLLVRGAAVPNDSELPASLAALTYRNGISVRPDPDFHRDMDRLIAGLEAHLGS